MKHLIRRLRASLHAWVERHIIADDPSPEYSQLDRWDNLGDGDDGFDFSRWDER